MKITNTKAMTRILVAWSCIVVVLGADAFANHNHRRPSSTMAVLPQRSAGRHPQGVVSSSQHSLLQATGSDDVNEEEDVLHGNHHADSESLSNNNNNSADDIPRGGAASGLKGGPPPQPSLTDFRKFALPCLGLWVAQPLLSLVDTVFVGLSGDAATSASQLAALGPATTFVDGATYLFAFLNVATTNLYSSARAQRGEQSDQAESVVRTASRVATRCGFGLLFFLLAFSRPLMALYIGMCVSLLEGGLIPFFL